MVRKRTLVGTHRVSIHRRAAILFVFFIHDGRGSFCKNPGLKRGPPLLQVLGSEKKVSRGLSRKVTPKTRKKGVVDDQEPGT